MRLIFFVAQKDRNWNLAQALAEGCKTLGDELEIVDQRQFNGARHDCDVAACLGLKRAGKRLLTQHLQAGKRFLFFDKAYMGRSEHVRVSLDSWQPLAYFRRNRLPDRFERLGIELRPLRESTPNGHIIFAGSSQKYCNFHDLGDATAYAERIVRRLRKATHSRREIVYRPKPSWAANHQEECRPVANATFAGPEKPLAHWLEGAHLLVTHGSNAAFDALAAGVPVMVLGNGICRPMSMGEDYGGIEDPWFPDEEERRQFFADAAWCQWTLEELRSGEAWADMKAVMATLAAPENRFTDADAEYQYIVEQYRIMHRSPKYFRGRETVKHFPKIWKLILQTGAKTLLDYGSGKGEAWEPPLNLHEQFEVVPHCYDPAVERFCKIPRETGADGEWDGRFDCVVCCDVMEHIPEGHVPRVLRDIMGRARKFAFLSIATMPASKTLPCGMNCHVTVRPEEWWRERLEEARLAANPGLVVSASIYNEPMPDNPDFDDDD